MCQTTKQDWHKNATASSLTPHGMLNLFQHLFNSELLLKFQNKQTLKQVQGDSFVQGFNFVNSRRKAGFTLAEVLVVITIIGVIASLTIPDLIANIQEQQYKSAWKKNFAVLSQATINIKEDNGGTMVGFAQDDTYFTYAYAGYLNVLKTCNSANFGQNYCWHSSGQWSDLRGVPQISDGYSAILADGALIISQNGSLWADQDGCTNVALGVESCGIMRVDTNGFKGPNVIGKDILGFHITKDGLVPFGAQNSSYATFSHCDTDPPDNPSWARGWSCASAYLSGAN